MRIPTTKPLFAWDCLEGNPSLQTLKNFFDLLPDTKLLQSLQRFRGKGRNDYPVHVLWRTALLCPLLRHQWIDSCLQELRRNPSLWPIIGIDDAGQVPNKWNISRFMLAVGAPPHLTLVMDVFNAMVRLLAEVVPDLGERCAADSTALHARRQGEPTGKRTRPKTDLPQPDGGHKEYTDDDGVVTRIIEWFGFKAHLLVDVKHEVILSYAITPASTHDCKAIPTIVQQAVANVPNPKATEQNRLPKHRIKTLAYDKAGDDEGTHALLDAAGIKPVIQIRSCWKGEPERMLPGHDGTSNIVYDEAGTIYCYDKVSATPVRHRMAYIGQEPDRRTVKYRCPAMHEGFACPSHERCNCGLKYGKTVRVPRDTDIRRFTAIPRDTKQFERLYKGRTAVERVNARIKILWGADDGNIVGSARFHAFFGAVMIVHIGLAILLASAPREEGGTDRRLGTMHLGYIARQLQKKIRQQQVA